MADIKWIKITTDMFDDDKIKLIEKMPDADTLLVIWVKLICHAGKVNNNGAIYLTPEIPFNEETLSTVFNRPVNTIRLALETFKNLSMIELDGNGVIYLVNFEKHQNIDGLDKVRELARNRQQTRRLRLTNANTVLLRDNYTCQYCGSPATGVDHIVPVSSGGAEEDINRVASCRRCNQRKMIQDIISFLNNPTIRKEGWLRHDLIQNNSALKAMVKLLPNQLYQLVTLQVSDVTQQIRLDKIRLDKNTEKDEELQNVKILINEKRYDEIVICHQTLSTIIRCLNGEYSCSKTNIRLYLEELKKLDINLDDIGVTLQTVTTEN